MEFQQLRYFAEIAKQRSFSRASTTLRVSQPSLSKVVKSLEEELGVVLFNRTTRQLQVTDDGEIVLKYASAMLSMTNDLHTSLNEGRQLRTGKLALGLPPVIGASFFPGMIADFRRKYPGVRVRLVEEGGKVVEQLVREGKIDVGVVVLPVDEEAFGTFPIAERQLSLIVGAGHALAGADTVRLTDLKSEPFILFKEGFSLYDRVREACIREGFDPNVAYESSQWDLIGEMVGAGLGISFLPNTVTRKLDPASVRVIPETEPPIRWNLALIWSNNHYLSHAARAWIELVKSRERERERDAAGAEG